LQSFITISSQIDFIVNKLVKSISGVDAIILYGGYGRDEGSIYYIDKTALPYNDFDLVVVTDSRVSSSEIFNLSEEIARNVNVKWIDLSCKSGKSLVLLKYSIFNYDLKYGSRVIYGDKDILSLIPEMDAKNLLLIEGETLFFTRLWTLLGSLDYNGLNVGRAGEGSRFFRNQMAKAVLAVVDVILLQNGQYHHSYKERVKRLQGLTPHRTAFLELADWALKEKLEPKAPDMSAKEVKELYIKVHECFFDEMFILLSAYYNIPVHTPRDIERHLKWSFNNLVKRIGWIILRRNWDWEKNINLKLAQAFIAFAYNKKDLIFLKQGINYLRKLDNSFPAKSSWDEARVKIANLRLGQ